MARDAAVPDSAPTASPPRIMVVTTALTPFSGPSPSAASMAARISAGSAMQMGLAFAGLLVVGAMAMAMYEVFSWIERHTTAWAHRGSHHH